VWLNSYGSGLNPAGYSHQNASPVGAGADIDLMLGYRFGLKAGFNFSTFATKRRVTVPSAYSSSLSYYSNSRDIDFESRDSLFSFFLAPEYRFGIGKIDLSFYWGPALSFRSRNWENEVWSSWGGTGPYVTKSQALGVITGIEGGSKLGPGILYGTLNGSWLWGLNKDKDYGISSYWDHNYNAQLELFDPYGNFKSGFSVNIGVGYRFGFITKRQRFE
jgi:hypothetical protein